MLSRCRFKTPSGCISSVASGLPGAEGSERRAQVQGRGGGHNSCSWRRPHVAKRLGTGLDRSRTAEIFHGYEAAWIPWLQRSNVEEKQPLQRAPFLHLRARQRGEIHGAALRSESNSWERIHGDSPLAQQYRGCGSRYSPSNPPSRDSGAHMDGPTQQKAVRSLQIVSLACTPLIADGAGRRPSLSAHLRPRLRCRRMPLTEKTFTLRQQMPPGVSFCLWDMSKPTIPWPPTSALQ